MGKLSWQSIPWDQPVPLASFGVVLVLIALLAAWVTRRGLWPWVWHEWITTVDHKRIGILYVLLAIVMLVRGFVDALMMRSQQAIAAGSNPG